MAVRFQTQGSGRQSRNKIAFLVRGIGLTRCQIKGLFTHTHAHKWVHILLTARVCVRLCVQACPCYWVSALAVRRWGHVQKSVSEHPLMEYRTAFKVNRTNSATQGWYRDSWMFDWSIIPAGRGHSCPASGIQIFLLVWQFLLSYAVWGEPPILLSLTALGFICNAVISL